MNIYPPITLTLLNGFLLILGLIAVRFGIPALIDKKSLAKLDYFAPAQGAEQTALRIYFPTNYFLLLSPLLARLQTGTAIATAGWVVYAVGMVLLALALIHFSQSNGMVKKGVYRFSRNPIYVGYFLIYIGVGLLIGSWTYLIVAAIYQIATHYLILSEERWCEQSFGEPYAEYMRRVPRYL